MKRIELKLKVSINCSKCKTQFLKAVAKLEGVDEMAVDAERGIITVVGDVDPVQVAKKIRKTGKNAEIIYVGAPEALEDPVTPEHLLLPSCPQCSHVFIGYELYADRFGGGSCTIMKKTYTIAPS